MNTNTFWRIIAAARENAGEDIDGRVDALEAQLQLLSPEDLIAFENVYDEQIRRSYRWDMWGAAYLMNGGCSNDGFRYFRDWLISEGSETFEVALRSPDSLADLPTVDFAELELFGYVAAQVYEAKTGKELERDFSTEVTAPVGQEWKEEDLPRCFPAWRQPTALEVQPSFCRGATSRSRLPGGSDTARQLVCSLCKAADMASEATKTAQATASIQAGRYAIHHARHSQRLVARPQHIR